jgi:hypothetical protein
MEAGLPLSDIQRAGFSYIDTQINFRIVLRDRSAATAVEELEVRSADDPRFELAPQDWCSFQHERYQFLEGVSQESIDRRYQCWAADLVSRNPSCCLQLFWHDEPQGWFLAQPLGGSALNLTLAVLHRKATASGFAVYARALQEYARLGFRSGRASFSILHTAVHNLYANMGARFETPVAIWCWTPRPMPGVKGIEGADAQNRRYVPSPSQSIDFEPEPARDGRVGA